MTEQTADSASGENLQTTGDGTSSEGDCTSSEIVAAVRRRETVQTGLRVQLAIALGSMVLFIALGALIWDPLMVVLLVVVLLFHELGHFAAMRLFGYRNIKMFFVPMLGAAVSGRHFQIASWKKAIVALAGPVPGLLLVTAGMLLGWFDGRFASLMTLVGLTYVLNVLNLLPLLPLDGGWILQLTFFRRSPSLQWMARVSTVVIMAVAGWWLGDPILLFIAIPLALAIPMTIRVARLIGKIDPQTVPPPQRDSLPRAAIEILDAHLRDTSLGQLQPRARAAWILHMYESLVVPPPRFRETAGILTMYAAAWSIAAVGGILLWHRFRDDPSPVVDQSWLAMPLSHQLALDSAQTDLRLGKETHGGLAILQTNSRADLLAALEEIPPGQSDVFTRWIGDDWMVASLPLQPPSMSDDDAFTAHWNAMRPTPVGETWLANLRGWLDDHPTADLQLLTGLFAESIEIRVTAQSHEQARNLVTTHFQSPRTSADRLPAPAWAGDPASPRRWAAHVSGSQEPGSTEVTLHVHRANDMAAAIAGLIQWLSEQGFDEFRLHFLAAGDAASK